MFILHDLEEIIMIEKWIKKNSDVIDEKLPRKIAHYTTAYKVGNSVK
jgi:hypothetical protein